MQPFHPEDRAQRILEAFRPVICHDLPNMVVALKGLLQMLHAEAQEQLSPSSQEYLSRLSQVAGRLQTTVAAMRAINKAATGDAEPQLVRLAEVLKEAAAAAKPSLAGRQLHFHSVLKCAAVTAPEQLLQQALTELISLLGRLHKDDEIHYYFTSRRVNNAVELMVSNCVSQLEFFETEFESVPKSPLSPHIEQQSLAVRDYIADKPEYRLQLALAEEIAATWHGKLTAGIINGQSYVFTLLLPSTSP